MIVNQAFYKNFLLQWLEDTVHQERTRLVDELIACSTDSVKYRRRFRMLRQLSQLHAQLIDKIYNFDTDNAEDILNIGLLKRDIMFVVARDA
jgi:hypothetical protein